MFLKNYYVFQATLATNGQAPLGKYVKYSGSQATVTWQSGYAWTYLNYVYAMSIIRTHANDYGIIFGTGDTPVTIDDYKLSGNIVTNIAGNTVINHEFVDGGHETTCVCTITNTGGSSVTIKEAGLMMANYSLALCERTVLDTPVTIPAGGVGQVTYKIRLNYPTA